MGIWNEYRICGKFLMQERKPISHSFETVLLWWRRKTNGFPFSSHSLFSSIAEVSAQSLWWLWQLATQRYITVVLMVSVFCVSLPKVCQRDHLSPPALWLNVVGLVMRNETAHCICVPWDRKGCSDVQCECRDTELDTELRVVSKTFGIFG